MFMNWRPDWQAQISEPLKMVYADFKSWTSYLLVEKNGSTEGREVRVLSGQIETISEE